MAPDEPFEIPRRMPHTEPRPREVLYEFIRESDQAQFRCELQTYEGWGVEAIFWMDGELLTARRFDTRALAVQWATIEREHIAQGMFEKRERDG